VAGALAATNSGIDCWEVADDSIRAITVRILLFGLTPSAAQQTSLELKTPVERLLTPKDASHDDTVKIQGNQTFTITVAQQGIDVVVTVLGPDGQQFVE
jgi:hypothetical protein